MYQIIPAVDCTKWRSLLSLVGQVDASYLPEYHLAYSLRIKDSEPLLWYYSEKSEYFLYPFLLTPVMISSPYTIPQHTGYYDVSSIYGYTGPIATTASPDFITSAWSAFDDYVKRQKLIAEFIRFSPFNNTERFAHPNTIVEVNRHLAVSLLPGSEEVLLNQLGSKTRNMLSKAKRAGLTAKELALPEYLQAFRQLYDQTMIRNQAREFFWYDDAYYQKLIMLGKDCLRLFGVFAGEKLVAAAMAVVHGKSALYHLGVSLTEYAQQGAGNLNLFHLSCSLMQSGVEFINMTGGRTTAEDDPLLRFKKSNSTGTAEFYIGKRILNHVAYQNVSEIWQKSSGKALDANKIIFWRTE